MKKIIVGLSLIIFSGVALETQAQKTDKKKDKLPLEGETYITQIEASSTDGKAPAKGKPDEMSFKSGKLKSSYFDEKGSFSASNYTVTKDSVDADEDRYIEFESILKNDAEEEVEIKGTVVGYDIEGTAKWSKNGKVKKEFSFSGGIKKSK